MKKWIITIAAVVVLVLVAAVAGTLIYIDAIAKQGVERGSSYALGVPTSLDSADVGVLSGEFSLAGFEVDNPQGDYTTDDFLKLADGNVAVTLGTLMKDTVEIPTLTLDGLSMNLERKGAKANYQVILDNLKRFETGEKPADPEQPAKKFVIRTLQIRNVNVHVDLVPVGGTLTQVDVPIDEIKLQDVGTGGKPVKLSDLTGVILKAVMNAAVQKGGDLIPDDIAGELTAGLSQLQDLGDQGIEVLLGDGGVVKTVGKTAEELGQKADEAARQIGEGAEKIGDEAKKIGEGIGDIFKKDKKDDDN